MVEKLWGYKGVDHTWGFTTQLSGVFNHKTLMDVNSFYEIWFSVRIWVLNPHALWTFTRLIFLLNLWDFNMLIYYDIWLNLIRTSPYVFHWFFNTDSTYILHDLARYTDRTRIMLRSKRLLMGLRILIPQSDLAIRLINIHRHMRLLRFFYRSRTLQISVSLYCAFHILLMRINLLGRCQEQVFLLCGKMSFHVFAVLLAGGPCLVERSPLNCACVGTRVQISGIRACATPQLSCLSLRV